MSSYTDFYFGRGDKADWIGSLRGECYPANFLAVPPSLLALTATDESTFRAAVVDTLDVWENERFGHAYRRELGWPWPWYTSHNSSWTMRSSAVTERLPTGHGWTVLADLPAQHWYDTTSACTLATTAIVLGGVAVTVLEQALREHASGTVFPPAPALLARGERLGTTITEF